MFSIFLPPRCPGACCRLPDQDNAMSTDSDSTEHEITVRRAGVADLDAILALANRHRDELGEPPRAPLDVELLADERTRILLAEDAGAAVGMLAIHVCHSLFRAGDVMLLSDIYVLPEQRRSGVAGALMEHAETLARRQGCERMSLMVGDVNNAALVTAARSGFSEHDELLFNKTL